MIKENRRKTRGETGWDGTGRDRKSRGGKGMRWKRKRRWRRKEAKDSNESGIDVKNREERMSGIRR